ncbi:hypothetical protein BGZ65_006004 [Modicella reniformis]|uniref:Uncharacterized protein n=1 Tax=Modicella reniformis TaxID=1440133 RepID=A0A9P6SVI1_9FUNG|nr:hypothetical protein BGZ65_006004 [Modicella reniformis]
MILSRSSQTHPPLVPYTLLVLLSLWTRTVTAKLACTSPTSIPSGIQPGSPILLGFSDSANDSILSEITANLVCSSTRTVALTLGKGYSTKDFSPYSPLVTITETQATAALVSCPGNSFYVEYTATAEPGQQAVAQCNNELSIHTAKTLPDRPPLVALGIDLPIPTVPLPIPLPPTSIPTSANPPTTTPHPSLPPPTTSASPPTVPTEAPTPTSKDTEPPAKTTSTPAGGTKTTPSPRSSKTSQTQQPSSGPGSGDGNGGGTNSPNPNLSTGSSDPSPSNKDSSSSSDLQQTGTSAPSIVTIAAACAGVVGGVLVILAAILIWRKREQRRQRVSFDEFYNESLAAASGFNNPTYDNDSNKYDNNSRRPNDLEQGYDGYAAAVPGPAPVGPPMRQYRGGH